MKSVIQMKIFLTVIFLAGEYQPDRDSWELIIGSSDSVQLAAISTLAFALCTYLTVEIALSSEDLSWEFEVFKTRFISNRTNTTSPFNFSIGNFESVCTGRDSSFSEISWSNERN